LTHDHQEKPEGEDIPVRVRLNKERRTTILRRGLYKRNAERRQSRLQSSYAEGNASQHATGGRLCTIHYGLFKIQGLKTTPETIKKIALILQLKKNFTSTQCTQKKAEKGGFQKTARAELNGETENQTLY